MEVETAAQNAFFHNFYIDQKVKRERGTGGEEREDCCVIRPSRDNYTDYWVHGDKIKGLR
jgi:hypothetical protein